MIRFLIFSAVLILAACDARNSGDIRSGPQAVHPASTAPGTVSCGAIGQPTCS